MADPLTDVPKLVGADHTPVVHNGRRALSIFRWCNHVSERTERPWDNLWRAPRLPPWLPAAFGKALQQSDERSPDDQDFTAENDDDGTDT